MALNPQIPLSARGFEMPSPLGQASGLMQILGALQQNKLREAQLGEVQRKSAQDQEMRTGLMDLLKTNPDQNALARFALQYGSSQDILKTQQSSLDRQATLQGQKLIAQENAASRLEAARERIGAQLEMARQRGADQRTLAEMQIAGRRELAQVAAGMRQPPAPSITEISDPLNPKQMIKVDTRTYNEGAYRAGDRRGVVGASGKEPTFAKREEKEGQGRDHLQSEIDNLRVHFETLKDAGAIPSSSNEGLGNVMPYVRSSGVGQAAGRVFGTKEQDARNQIQSSKLRLLNAIKNATGMSAQQLNSNTELKTWLDSVTNLNNTYESNVGILESIESAFVKGKKNTKQIDGAPKLRRETDKIKFLGYE